MNKLTSEEMNLAYKAIVETFGNNIDTEHNGLTMFVTIKSDCNGNKDKTGIIFDQENMTIYEKPACCEKCKCRTAVDKLVPVINTAIAVSRL